MSKEKTDWLPAEWNGKTFYFRVCAEGKIDFNKMDLSDEELNEWTASKLMPIIGEVIAERKEHKNEN